MLANLAVSILDKERVITTVSKAKEVRGVVERLITYGKKNSLHGIRLAAKTINSKTIIKKLFDDIAPSYKDREGGYTRIIRHSDRKGDNAELAIIELVGRAGDTPRKRKKKKKVVKKEKKVFKGTQIEKIKKESKKSGESVALKPEDTESKPEIKEEASKEVTETSSKKDDTVTEKQEEEKKD